MCGWLGEEVSEEFAYYGGRSGADGVWRDYSSWLWKWRELTRGRRRRAGSNANGWIRHRKRLCVLTLSFLNLSHLFVVRCSEFFEPGVRIGVYALDVLVRTRLFWARYPVVC
jgi:hypothetical protein